MAQGNHAVNLPQVVASQTNFSTAEIDQEAYLAMEPCVDNLPEQGCVCRPDLFVHLQPAREGHIEHDHQHHVAVAVPAASTPASRKE